MSWALKTIERLLLRVWSPETAHNESWSPENPAEGQCAVTSLRVQDLLGGQIERLKVDGASHYYNRIAGHVVDLTASQFEFDIDHDGKVIDSAKLLKNKNTSRRYSLLFDGMDRALTTKLPSTKVSHVVIRDPNYVAGNREKPEVRVFVQATQGRRPLNPDKLAVRQKVYMKWSGGPIVAESRVLSWHEAAFEDGNVNKARELTVGTMLFGMDDYWESVQAKENGMCGVVRLTDEKWLKKPLYSTARSRGSSWIYLDTLEKQIRWRA